MTTTPTTATVRTRATRRPSATQHQHDVGLLLLRLALGLIMAVHGAQKLFGWFGGGGLSGTEAFFASVGYPAAGTLAVVAGVTETFGGLALAFGMLTPLAAAAVLGTMLNALAITWSGAFFAPEGVEYEVLLVVVAAALALTGPGRFSVDHTVPALREHRLTTHGVAAVALGTVTAAITLLIRD